MVLLSRSGGSSCIKRRDVGSTGDVEVTLISVGTPTPLVFIVNTKSQGILPVIKVGSVIICKWG